jgi:hypothetical protein
MSNQAIEKISICLAFAIVLIGIGHMLGRHHIHHHSGQHRDRFHQESDWVPARAERPGSENL